MNTTVGDVAKIGLGQCMKNKWVKKDGDKIVRVLNEVKDETAHILKEVDSGVTSISEKILQDFKKRKLVQQITRKSYKISKGPEFKPQRVRKMADLTKEMLGNKTEMASNTHWSDFEFKNILIE